MSVEAPNKSQLVALASEAGSFATRTSSEFDFRDVSSLYLTVKLANEVGTGSFTPKIQRKLKNGDWVDWWTAAAALTTAGTYMYAFGRGATGTAAAVTEKIELPVPMFARLVLTNGGAGDGNEFDTYAEWECSP